MIYIIDDQEEESIADYATELDSTILSIRNNEEVRRLVDIKIEKYNQILKSITGDLDFMKARDDNNERGEVDEVENIDLTKGPTDLLNTTTEALKMLNLGNKKKLTREQLETLVDTLALMGIEHKEQIKNDISLIADIDENCFRYAYTR